MWQWLKVMRRERFGRMNSKNNQLTGERDSEAKRRECHRRLSPKIKIIDTLCVDLLVTAERRSLNWSRCFGKHWPAAPVWITFNGTCRVQLQLCGYARGERFARKAEPMDSYAFQSYGIHSMDSYVFLWILMCSNLFQCIPMHWTRWKICTELVNRLNGFLKTLKALTLRCHQ